jgi:serine/threonine protein kinase
LEQVYDVLSIIHMPLDQPNAFGYSRVLSSLYVLMARNWICCLLQNLASIVPGLEPAGVDLLSKMLMLEPSQRVTARNALEHEYFKDIGLIP